MTGRTPRRAWLVLSVVALVVALAAVGGIVVARGHGGGPSCPGGDALRPPFPPGDPRLEPFSPDSVWNQRLPAGVTQAEADPRATASIRATELTGTDATPATVRTWLNAETYSVPVVEATECDPVVQLQWRSSPVGHRPITTDVRIPVDAQPAAGADHHLVVIQPDRRSELELWGAEKVDDHTWSVGRASLVDLTGTGVGPDGGVRAFGGSVLGGLIRDAEVDPAHPAYTGGAIRHALAVALPDAMLRYTGGEPGYDANGYGTALGYVFPATEQDYDSPSTYRGPIPMGARVAIPSNVDLDSLGLDPQVRAIGQALQDYGGYVVDSTGTDTVTFYAQSDVPSSWTAAVRAPDGGALQLTALRQALVVLPPPESGSAGSSGA